MRPIVRIAAIAAIAAIAFRSSTATPPQHPEQSPFRFAVDAHDAEFIRPLLVTPAVHPVDKSDDRIADLERRVSELERRCKCEPVASYVAPQPAEKPAGMVCDANGCRIVQQPEPSGVPPTLIDLYRGSGGGCSSGSCGPAAGFRPFGGLFRRR